ncbi:MAG: transcription repressor NadR [Clostridia bacterium]|nr:transcription repressor NadR [Clostridia bacterium]
MKGEERRMIIYQTLKSSGNPVSGTTFSKQFGVSRQVIVQDIALLRAEGNDIVSTNHGYLLSEHYKASRVFKVCHTDEQIESELNAIVDLGGKVKDVFVSHKYYGLLQVELGINSRADIARYLETIKSGKSTPLLNLTSGYHYHTVLAEDEAILDSIQESLSEKGFLAQLQDYEPVDFWKN